MDPISNTDRLVRLLRQKLEERAKTKGRTPTGEVEKARPRGMDAVRAVTGHVAKAGADDPQLHRTLVEQLLADQFGPEMINEPKFQQIVNQVAGIMASDPAVASLLSGVVGELRRQGI